MLDTRFEIPDPAQPRRERTGSAPSAPLVPFIPQPLRTEDVVGQRITAVSNSLGTYGMGGAGFFGLQLDSCQWLVVAVRGAAGWMTAQGRAIEDFFYQDHRRQRPWLTDDNDELSPRITGRAIAGVDVQRTSLSISLDDGFVLRIEENSASRPIFEGSKQKREFAASDDLRAAVFLSPTDEIWV